jgi:hypothetical protein
MRSLVGSTPALFRHPKQGENLMSICRIHRTARVACLVSATTLRVACGTIRAAAAASRY